MTATEMDDAPAPYSPPALRTPGRPPAWVGALQSRERRWWTAALAATLLVSATAIGLLYMDDSNNQATLRSLQTSNESLTGRNQILNDQLKATQTNLVATLGELAKTKAQLEHPQLVLWNSPLTVHGGDGYLAGGIPDTFTYHLQATASGPMNVSILTLQQWASAIECAKYGNGTTNYCMHHQGGSPSWASVTSVNFDFHGAEGCADYIAVFTAATTVTVTPNVSVTYNPASAPTGACA